MHTLLYFYVCVQFLQPAACSLQVHIMSHNELLPLQFLLVLPDALSGVTRLWRSSCRHLGWPGVLVSGDRHNSNALCDVWDGKALSHSFLIFKQIVGAIKVLSPNNPYVKRTSRPSRVPACTTPRNAISSHYSV
jgi:hypothetical protein